MARREQRRVNPVGELQADRAYVAHLAVAASDALQVDCNAVIPTASADLRGDAARREEGVDDDRVVAADFEKHLRRCSSLCAIALPTVVTGSTAHARVTASLTHGSWSSISTEASPWARPIGWTA